MKYKLSTFKIWVELACSDWGIVRNPECLFKTCSSFTVAQRFIEEQLSIAAHNKALKFRAPNTPHSPVGMLLKASRLEKLQLCLCGNLEPPITYASSQAPWLNHNAFNLLFLYQRNKIRELYSLMTSFKKKSQNQIGKL